MKLKFLLLVSLWGLLNSCNDCTFETENISSVRIGFFDRATGTVIDTSFTEIRGLGADTTSYQESDGAQQFFELELLTGAGVSIFEIVQGEERDTIAFSFDLKLDVSTPDCGVNERIENLQVSGSTYDSVSVVQSIITIKNAHDIEIYQ